MAGKTRALCLGILALAMLATAACSSDDEGDSVSVPEFVPTTWTTIAPTTTLPEDAPVTIEPSFIAGFPWLHIEIPEIEALPEVLRLEDGACLSDGTVVQICITTDEFSEPITDPQHSSLANRGLAALEDGPFTEFEMVAIAEEKLDVAGLVGYQATGTAVHESGTPVELRVVRVADGSLNHQILGVLPQDRLDELEVSWEEVLTTFASRGLPSRAE